MLFSLSSHETHFFIEHWSHTLPSLLKGHQIFKKSRMTKVYFVKGEIGLLQTVPIRNYYLYQCIYPRHLSIEKKKTNKNLSKIVLPCLFPLFGFKSRQLKYVKRTKI